MWVKSASIREATESEKRQREWTEGRDGEGVKVGNVEKEKKLERE